MRNRPLEEGQRWLRQAQEDLHWSRHLAEQGGYHLACFLSQQVAEKALKAFLYALGPDIEMAYPVSVEVQQTKPPRRICPGNNVVIMAAA